MAQPNEENRQSLLNASDQHVNATEVDSSSTGVRRFQFESAPQFRLPRILLRILSLWCPRKACCFERFLYPLLVNLYLLLLVCSPIDSLYHETREQTVYVDVHRIATYVLEFVMNMSAWLCHIAAVIYFRSHDLEDNMTNFTLWESDAKYYRKRLIYYNIRTAMSLLVLPLYAIGTTAVLRNRLFWWLSEGFHNYYSLSIKANEWLYVSGMFHIPAIYVSLLWIVDLLHITSKARLDKQYSKFLHWDRSVDDGILDHTENYVDKVECSCRGLHRWLEIHNFFLSLTLPAFIFLNGLSFLSSGLGILIIGCVVLVLTVVWVLPFYFADQIGKNDEHFRCTFNELCSMSPLVSALNTPTDEASVEIQDGRVEGGNREYPHRHLTFALRSNVESFIIFLDHTKSGFQVVDFTTQLRTSLISIFFTIFTVIFGLVHTYKARL